MNTDWIINFLITEPKGMGPLSTFDSSMKGLLGEKKHWIWVILTRISRRRAWQPTPVLLPGESLWTEEPAVYGAANSWTRRSDWAQHKDLIFLAFPFTALLIGSQLQSSLPTICRIRSKDNCQITQEIKTTTEFAITYAKNIWSFHKSKESILKFL